jgi:hypothetical protein
MYSQTSAEPVPISWIHQHNGREPGSAAGQQTSADFVVDLHRWRTTFEIVTHSNQTSGELFFDVVYQDIMGYAVTRARFHLDTSTSLRSWFADWIDYFSPPDSPEPRTRVSFH